MLWQGTNLHTGMLTKACLTYSLNCRHRQVLNHFPTALGVDDAISRIETVLAGYGFTGDNSIGELHSISNIAASSSGMCQGQVLPSNSTMI